MLIYLASPYSSKDWKISKKRYKQTKKATEYLLGLGYHVYSPIVYGHHINVMMDWLPMDFDILKRCDQIMVLMLDGWDESTGVSQEKLKASEYGIPIVYAAYEDGEVKWDTI